MFDLFANQRFHLSPISCSPDILDLPPLHHNLRLHGHKFAARLFTNA